MSALATASRIRILACLRARASTVGELTEVLGMEQPAVSHQLRILRDLRLVVGTRDGRSVRYGLHDSHVATLVDEALRHMEHLRGDSPDGTGTGRTDQRKDIMTETPHSHEHTHGDVAHSHAHVGHDHDHVEHAHEHSHDSETHAHDHVHEAGLEQAHEHAS